MPEPGVDLQNKILEIFIVVASSLGSGFSKTRSCGGVI
jgi:hypothetical protein